MPISIPAPEDLPPLTADELAELPIFPLPRMVFFPGTALPLHLFEARYREMIRDCTTVGPSAIAVALLEPGWEDDYAGQPPIASISGVGRIGWHEELPDGRYNVVLVGLGRARLEPLAIGGRSYRRARATLLPDSGSAAQSAMETLLGCARVLAQVLRTKDPAFELNLCPGSSPGRIADVLADRLVPDVARRQMILETADVATRIARVTEAVSHILADVTHSDDRGALH